MISPPAAVFTQIRKNAKWNKIVKVGGIASLQKCKIGNGSRSWILPVLGPASGDHFSIKSLRNPKENNTIPCFHGPRSRQRKIENGSPEPAGGLAGGKGRKWKMKKNQGNRRNPINDNDGIEKYIIGYTYNVIPGAFLGEPSPLAQLLSQRFYPEVVPAGRPQNQ